MSRLRVEDSDGEEKAEGCGGGRPNPIGPRRTGEFRVNAKSFAITYSQAGEHGIDSKGELFDHFINLGANRILVARERHEDSGHHFHCLVQFSIKRNITRADYFDYSGCHPNVQGCKDTSAWRRYCKKEGDWVENEETFDLDDWDLGKRQKAYYDYLFSRQYRRRIRCRDIAWPVHLKYETPEGLQLEHTIQDPNPAEKKRHLWIVSPPDAGKSYWVERLFANQKVWYVEGGPHRFEWYDGEKILIYDDVVPPFKEIASACNTYTNPKKVPGRPRYTSFYWGEDSRIVIILNNRKPDYYYDETLPAVLARFKVIEVKKLL